MAASKQKLAVIISPTYNERPNVKKLVPIVAKVIKNISDWDIKLLFVDDSSPDGTAEEIKQLQKKYSFVELLVNKKKMGLGGAYLAGMNKAFNQMGAQVVFEMDADLSHDPKILASFLRAIDAGADLVLGSRYIKGGSIPANWGFYRKFLSVVGNLTASVILGSTAVRDWTTGYRAIRKEVYDKIHPELLSERFSGYTFQIGFLHKSLRAGYKVVEVPFHFVDRTVGVSKLGPEYIINTLLYIVGVRLKELFNHRITKFAIVGGIGFVVNLTFYHLFRWLSLWTSLSSWLKLAGQNGWLSNLLSDEGLAVALSAEVAILSNYLWNNIWTFKDRQIFGFINHAKKFLQFNFGSLGSVVIQYLTMQISVLTFGVFTLLKVWSIDITSDNLYLIIGVLLGMVWNFTIYSRLIWRKNK
jgi:dolichol-phosphate mannosyltransferase